MKRKPGVSLTALGGVAGIMLFVLAFVVVVRVLAQPLVGESLTVVPIASGSGSLHPTAQELVITNDTDYANFFGGTPPASSTVNFSAEDVLAVTMGSSPAGSSSGQGKSQSWSNDRGLDARAAQLFLDVVA